MEIDDSHTPLIRQYLHTLKAFKQGKGHGSDLIKARFEKTHTRVIENARKALPIEFVDNIVIKIDTESLRKIAAEVSSSKNERLERAAVLVFSVQYSENQAALEMKEFFTLEWLEKHFGRIERREDGINAAQIKDRCFAESNERTMLSPLHTHTGETDTPSPSDFISHKLGLLDFVALFKGENFLLIPYRFDCSAKEPIFLGGRSAESRIYPSYLKIIFEVGGHKFEGIISIPIKDLSS